MIRIDRKEDGTYLLWDPDNDWGKGGFNLSSRIVSQWDPVMAKHAVGYQFRYDPDTQLATLVALYPDYDEDPDYWRRNPNYYDRISSEHAWVEFYTGDSLSPKETLRLLSLATRGDREAIQWLLSLDALTSRDYERHKKKRRSRIILEKMEKIWMRILR